MNFERRGGFGLKKNKRESIIREWTGTRGEKVTSLVRTEGPRRK